MRLEKVVIVERREDVHGANAPNDAAAPEEEGGANAPNSANAESEERPLEEDESEGSANSESRMFIPSPALHSAASEDRKSVV